MFLVTLASLATQKTAVSYETTALRTTMYGRYSGESNLVRAVLCENSKLHDLENTTINI